jgi:hypothetical protein
MAYFLVHSLAVASYRGRSVLYVCCRRKRRKELDEGASIDALKQERMLEGRYIRERSQAQGGHQGWGPSTSSRSKGGLEKCEGRWSGTISISLRRVF